MTMGGKPFRLPANWQQKHKPEVEIPKYSPTKTFVRQLRDALGVSREELCRYLDEALGEQASPNGCAVSTVARWERGKARPRYWPEEQILRSFACQVWEFRLEWKLREKALQEQAQ